MNAAIPLLLTALDQAYDKKAWHGPNLRGALRRVTAETASFRPGLSRRNIWELTVHAAYWKYVVRRKLLGEKRGSFPVKGSNWFPRPLEATAAAWKADLALLDETHRTLRAAVTAFEPRQLEQKPAGSRFRYLDLIAGVAAHDVYHAGQIQLLKRLAGQGQDG
jgi:uncharacterized damage-inducible protein DinB